MTWRYARAGLEGLAALEEGWKGGHGRGADDVLCGDFAFAIDQPVRPAGPKRPLGAQQGVELGPGQAWGQSAADELQTRLGSFGASRRLCGRVLVESGDGQDAVDASRRCHGHGRRALSPGVVGQRAGAGGQARGWVRLLGKRRSRGAGPSPSAARRSAALAAVELPKLPTTPSSAFLAAPATQQPPSIATPRPAAPAVTPQHPHRHTTDVRPTAIAAFPAAAPSCPPFLCSPTRQLRCPHTMPKESDVPQPGPARLAKGAGPDEWLEQAKLCRYLPEADMKRLCEIVKECLMEGKLLHHDSVPLQTAC